MSEDFSGESPPPLTDEFVRAALQAYGALLFDDNNVRLSPAELERARRRANSAFLGTLDAPERAEYERRQLQAIEARLEREEAKKEKKEAEREKYRMSFCGRHEKFINTSLLILFGGAFLCILVVFGSIFVAVSYENPTVIYCIIAMLVGVPATSIRWRQILKDARARP